MQRLKFLCGHQLSAFLKEYGWQVPSKLAASIHSTVASLNPFPVVSVTCTLIALKHLHPYGLLPYTGEVLGFRGKLIDLRKFLHVTMHDFTWQRVLL